MDKIQMEQMGERIKNARNSLGLTQEVAAENLEITYSSYTKIENGIVGVSLDTLLKIADLYSLSLDFIIYGKSSDDVDYRNIQSLIKLLDKDGVSNTIKALTKISNISKNLKDNEDLLEK